MKRNIIRQFLAVGISLTFLSHFEVYAQTDSADYTPYYKYRVSLKDKKSNEFSVKHPEAFLSQRAIERRHKQKLKIDETDLPVSGKYLDMLRQTGVNIEHTSKWNNTVVVSTEDTTAVARIEALSCVEAVRKVATYNRPSRVRPRNNECVPLDSAKEEVQKMKNAPYIDDYYGVADTQIRQLGGKALHQSGYKGQSMVIAVIDGGFTNADVVPVLTNTKILGTKDFVHRIDDFYNTGSHGMSVLTCMGGNVPGMLVGTAPEASFWLLLSEDGGSEQLVEEDNWAAAIEFADSVGADVVNTSLGYNNFDNPADAVHYWELDGHTHLISNSASMCAQKGMVLVNSAGNSGNDQWKLITSPADANDVLTVGALNNKGENTNFSSLGNTSDGRVKPDVMALGNDVLLCTPSGDMRPMSGTSFASPIMCGMVACLWQALPQLNAYQIIDIVRKAGNNANHPNNVYGYGLPDFVKAWENGMNL